MVGFASEAGLKQLFWSYAMQYLWCRNSLFSAMALPVLQVLVILYPSQASYQGIGYQEFPSRKGWKLLIWSVAITHPKNTLVNSNSSSQNMVEKTPSWNHRPNNKLSYGFGYAPIVVGWWSSPGMVENSRCALVSLVATNPRGPGILGRMVCGDWQPEWWNSWEMRNAGYNQWETRSSNNSRDIIWYNSTWCKMT